MFLLFFCVLAAGCARDSTMLPVLAWTSLMPGSSAPHVREEHKRKLLLVADRRLLLGTLTRDRVSTVPQSRLLTQEVVEELLRSTLPISFNTRNFLKFLNNNIYEISSIYCNSMW